jgi:hypothetical protein
MVRWRFRYGVGIGHVAEGKRVALRFGGSPQTWVLQALSFTVS